MTHRLRPSWRGAAKAVQVLMLTAALAGCAGQFDAENTGTVSADTVALMEREDMERGAPVLVRIFKEDRALEVWKQDRSGRFKPLRSYGICRFSGGPPPQQAAGAPPPPLRGAPVWGGPAPQSGPGATTRPPRVSTTSAPAR